MLQKLNERIQGIVAWVIIILIAVTFALFGVDYYLQSRQASNVEVEVNGNPITKQAFELNYRRARQALDDSHISETTDKQLKKQVLDEMIANQVSVDAARRFGFEVTPKQANAAIVNIPQFQEEGHFSAVRYQQALSGALFTPETFQAEVRQGMLLNQQRFAIIGTSFALPREVKNFVKLYMQTRDYQYLTVPISLFVDSIAISDSSIKQYYEKHPKSFMTPEKVQISYIKLSMKDIMTNVKVTEEQLKSYYEENKSNYLTPARWQVAHILFAVPRGAPEEKQKRIKSQADDVYAVLQTKPESFEENVQKWSDDKLSMLKKGELPWIVAGQSSLDKTLLNLTKPSQISKPVRTKHGYQIFKLLAYEPATIKPFSAVRSDIEQQLKAEKAQAEYANQLELLTDLTYQSPDSLEPAADALHVHVQKAGPFSRKDSSQNGLLKNKEIIQASFSHDVLTLGNNSEPIQVDNDAVVVLRVHKHIPSKRQPLSEVKKSIERDLKKKKAKTLAKRLGDSLINDQLSPEKRDALIKTHQLQWHSVARAPREASHVNSVINDLAFSITNAGEQRGLTLDNGNYALVHLLSINDGQLKQLDKEQIANITQQLEVSFGVVDYDLYVNGLLDKANIKHV